MRSSVPSRRLTRLGAIPLLFLTIVGLLLGGLSAPAFAAAGSIKGTVTRAGALDSTPLQGVTVTLLNADGTAVTAGNPAAPLTATTAPDGTYTLPTPDSTSSVSYKVRFNGTGLRQEFYNDAATAEAATSIPVGAGATVNGINAALASTSASQLGGKVTNASGAPIDGATITLYKKKPADAQTGQVSYETVISQTTGDGKPSGTWVLDQAFGKYVVEVKAPAFGVYYYSGNGSLVTNRDSAPEIEVKEGVATRLDATLTPQSTTSISGKVTANGVNVQGVEISVEFSQLDGTGQTTWTEVQGTKVKTAADGTYSTTVPPVSQGRTYVVGFKAPGFRTQYYTAPQQGGTDPRAFKREDGTPLSPMAGTPLTGISEDLMRATQVTGKVTDSAGAALAGVRVNAVVYKPKQDTAQYGEWVLLGTDGTPCSATPCASPVTTETLSDGTYALDVPANTRFRLQFQSIDQRPVRYFPGATFPDEGENLTVAPSSFVTGKDMTLPTASTVRGSLVETTGAPYAGTGTVTAWKEVTWSELGEKGGTTHTSWFAVPGSSGDVTNGAFTARVPQGSYRLKFVDSATAEEGFLPGLVGLDKAPDVVLGVEQSLPAKDYQMPSLQSVRGRVTDSALDPKVGAVVGAEYTYTSDIRDGVNQPKSPVIGPSASTRKTTTQTDGLYTLALRSRTYQVYALASALTADAGTKTFFGDKDETGARVPTPVVVNNSDVDGVDITLGGDQLTNTRAPFITGLNDEGSTLTAQPGTWTPEAGLSFNYVWSYYVPAAAGEAPDSDDQEPGAGAAKVCTTGANAVTTNCWQDLARVNSRSDGYGNPSVDGRSLVIPGDGPFCFPPLSDDGCTQNVRYRVRVIPVVNGVPRPADAEFGQYRTQTTSDTTPADEFRARPLILGKAVVGQTLTTDGGVWAQQSTYTYQWFRGSAEIAGATQSSYVPVPQDVGFNLKVQVVPTAHPNLEPAVSAQTARVGNGTISNTKPPLINGKAQVGETLTAQPGSWSPEPTSYSYVWSANNTPIPGATAQTYKPVEGDVGKVIRVQVTAKREGYTAATTTSDATGQVSLDGTDPTKLVNKTKPVVEGTAQVGKTLTAKSGDWTNSPTFTYQWLADGQDIANASGTTYVLAASDEGKTISVRVTARRQGFDSATATSDPTNPVAKGTFTNSARPRIDGLVKPGSTVTALPGTWTPSTGVTYSYQWLLDNVAINGATIATYAVKESDLEKLLSVRVTASSPGYTDLSSVSDQLRVTPDGDTTIDQTKASVINGDAVVGQTLRLVVGSTSPTFDTVAIQWLRNGIPVAGRTGTSYAVTEADLGGPVAARVTYKKTGYTDLVETVETEDVTEPVVAVAPEIDVVKKIKGSKLVLKVTVTADTQDPVTGDVELTENGQFLTSKALVDGKRKLVVKGLKKGFHTVKLTFLGNDLVKQRSKTLTFTTK